ncbi:MAG: ABC transporter substrate-binding protein [Planctomycetota bacterium]|jgi:ABC-type branched-subunit amino acid transport system substrate-binding protein
MSTKQLPTGAVILAALIWGPGRAALAAAPPGADPAPAPQVYGSWQTFTTRDGLPHDRVLALHASGHKVWVGTAGGLALLEHGSWTSWTEQDGLPAPTISAIAVDPRTRDVWLGTWGGGLLRFSGGRFDQFSQINSGLAGDLVFAVVVTDNRIWAATNGGLSSFDVTGDAWDLHFERRTDTQETAIMGLSLEGRRLYAAAWCGGLIEVEPGLERSQWSLLAAPAIASAVPREDTTLGVAAGAGSLWWATQESLLRRDATEWDVRRLPRPGVAGRFVNCIGAAVDGSVCLGTDDGLEALIDWPTATWVTYDRFGPGPQGLVTVSRHGKSLDARVTSSGLPDDRVRCIAFQGDDMWVGTAGGLAQATGRKRLADLPAPPATAADQPIASEPQIVDVVKIGVITPRARAINVPGKPAGGAPDQVRFDSMAVSLAIEQANARGGYRGRIPFALGQGPQGWFRGWGWTTAEDDFPNLAQQRDIVGMVAYVGSASRLTTAVVLRTEIPVVNFAPAPATVDELINPWIFRCRVNEPQRHRLLLDYIFDHLGCARLGVLRDTGALDQAPVHWWVSEAGTRGQPVVADLRCDPGTEELDAVLRALEAGGADVVLTWSDAPRSAAILRAMRRAGMSQVFIGSHEIMSDEFAALAGSEPGSVLALCPPARRTDHAAAARFADDYMQRFKRPPRPDAFGVFQAANHLMEAINIGGPDREAVRRALADMSRDLEGERHWDQALGPDQAILGRLQGGNWNLYTISDLGLTGP